jgi:hypothetical protein
MPVQVQAASGDGTRRLGYAELAGLGITRNNCECH